MPFYIGWTSKGDVLYWTFGSATLLSNQPLPALPRSGIQTADGVRDVRGARLMSEQPYTFPGPSPSVYAFIKVATQRNIYRFPVH